MCNGYFSLFTVMLHRYAAPLCCTVMLRRYAAPLCCAVMLRRHAASSCCVVMLHRYAAPLCCTVMLHRYAVAHVPHNWLFFVSGVTQDVGLVGKLEMMPDSCSQLMLTIISCIGIPGNIMVLIVILSSPVMRYKVYNMFIVHQSAIDLLACVCTLLLQFFNDMNSVKNGKGMRKK